MRAGAGLGHLGALGDEHQQVRLAGRPGAPHARRPRTVFP